MRALFRFVIRLYQLIISPLLPSTCRFTPTCSHYAREAIEIHGSLKGSLLVAKRIAHCHPFGACGHDPVPSKPEIQNHP